MEYPPRSQHYFTLNICSIGWGRSLELILLQGKKSNNLILKSSNRLKLLPQSVFLSSELPVMLYHSPLVAQSDFEVAHRKPASRVHRVQHDREWTSLQSRVQLQREISLALCLRSLVQSSHHDDYRRALRPGHAPEILDRVRQRTLCRYVTRVVVVAL